MSKIIGIVGAGTMGSGIAQKYAMEGFQVILADLHDEALKTGKARIDQSLDEAQQRKILSKQTRDDTNSRLTYASDILSLKKASLIIEAVFEDLAIKQNLFHQLDSICDAETILATNTSSFYVRQLSAVTQRQDRVLGLHYFFHPAKNRLVEVIKGPQTSSEAFSAAWKIQEQIGKLPVESKDSPGFIVNRFFVPWLNEAMRIAFDGQANIPTIEAACKVAFGISMGPFELMNVTGVPITYHAANSLASELGEFYKPCELILPLVKHQQQWDLDGKIDSFQFEFIRARMLSVVFDIAQKMVFAEKVCSLEDCDLSARVGLKWKKGPFELMKEFGKNKCYSIKFVKSEIENGVGFITFNRPDALNALNEKTVEQLREQFAHLSENPAVHGIVIEGRGKAFAAGADIDFFVEQIQHDNVARIVEFATNGQRLFKAIDASKKPVVACVQGLALGGGLELALACDKIVATPDARLGFPETGIGIYPGLGGTQRTPRRIGVPLARWLVLTGDLVTGANAKLMGLVDEVVPREQLRSRAASLASVGGLDPRDRPEDDKGANGFGEIEGVFAEPLEDLIMQATRLRSEKIGESLRRLAKKAPLALAKADELIQMAALYSLDEGLAAETAGLSQIFSTKDAFLGLASAGKNPPIFTGE